MIIKEYEKKGLLLNIAFAEAADDPQTVGFRGRLALVEGEIADDAGNRKPPHIVMEQTTLLSKGDKLVFLSGSLDRLEDLPALIEMYKGDFAADMLAILYVVNITAAMQVEIEGINFALIPMREGVAWNELMDEGGLDKLDLKKLPSGEKVVTVYESLSDFKPKGEKVTLEEALSRTADITRVERGAL
ncbi:hypothetical protein [Endothiovibrio diazotrophicus]